jgi:hypothetical protein
MLELDRVPDAGAAGPTMINKNGEAAKDSRPLAYNLPR